MIMDGGTVDVDDADFFRELGDELMGVGVKYDRTCR